MYTYKSISLREPSAYEFSIRYSSHDSYSHRTVQDEDFTLDDALQDTTIKLRGGYENMKFYP
jgi:hypothetical protein